MRPISLTIKGLHSFRQEQNVDFTSISDVGIFGIFGPTGSGKSSILDAITLALYGRVERSDANRVGIINQQEDKVYVKYIFALALAKSSLIYTVERVYSRIDNQRLKSTLARLVLSESGKEVVIADKEKEVTKEIEAILGLTVDDFTRAVVLPQGKFAEFLTLKAADRRPMLERLFRLDQYGKKLKDKAQNRENNFKKQRDELLAKMEVLSHASKDNLDNIREVMHESKNIVKENEKEIKTFLIDYNQKQNRWENQLKLIDINNLLDDLNNNEDINAENITKKKNAEKARLIEPTLDLYNKLNDDKSRSNNRINELKELKEILQKETSNKKDILDNYKNIVQTETSFLTEKKIKLQEALEWEKQIKDFNNEIVNLNCDLEEVISKDSIQRKDYENIHKETTEIKNEINNLKKIIENTTILTSERKQVDRAWDILRDQKRIDEEIKKINIDLKEYKMKIKDIEKKIDSELKKIKENESFYAKIEDEIRNMNNNKPIELEDWYKTDRSLTELVINTNLLEDNYINVESLKNEQESYEEERKTLRKGIKELKQLINKKENMLKEDKDELISIEDKDYENLARKLAVKLEKGKPCLVCGSTDHPFPPIKDILANQEIENRFSLLKDNVYKYELELVDLTSELRELENKLSIIDANLEKNVSDLNKHKIMLDKRHLELPKEYKDLTINQINDKVNQEKKLHEDLKEDLDKWTAQFNQTQEKIKSTKENINKDKYKYKLLLSQVSNIKESEEKTIKLLANFKKEKESNDNKLTSINIDWDYNKIELVKKQIDETGEKQEEIRKELKDLEEISLKKESIIKEIENQSLEYKNKREQIGILLDNKNESKIKLEMKLNGLTDNLSANEAISKVTERLEQISKDLVKHEDNWNQKNNELIKTVTTINSEQAVLDNILIQYTSTYEKLAKFINVENWESIQTIEQNLMLQEHYEELCQEIKTYNDRKNLLMEQKRELLEKLDGLKLSDEEWLSLQEQKTKLEENIERNKLKLSESTFKYQQLEKEYDKYIKYDLKRKEIQYELDIASELNQILRGNSFVDFIAQEYLHNITIIASEKLRQLTRNRFSLEVDELGVFRLIDELNGSLSRPVQSLSGGETFLASLALALALSSQIQLKGEHPLEFFFLDEGFGSLDSDLLDTVMMTLEKLNSGNLIVGIISHLPELQSRVNRRFILEPPDSKGNGSRVKLEFA